MRDPRFLHVGLTYPNASPQVVAEIQKTIDSEAFDWMRYAIQCWLIWSSSDAETICRKILRVPGMEGATVFICAIDVNDGFGFLPAWAWEWIRRDRGNGPLVFWTPADQPGMPEWPGFGPRPPLLPTK